VDRYSAHEFGVLSVDIGSANEKRQFGRTNN
jgi:hypothetical protein